MENMWRDSSEAGGDLDKFHASKSNEILDVHCRTFSDLVIDHREVLPSRKAHSELKLSSEINYDELCGTTKYPDDPVWIPRREEPTPKCCLWKYITQENATYLRNHRRNKKIILEFIEKKFVCEKPHKGNNEAIIVGILWETFKFVRKNWVSDKVISAILGLIYLTHLFFLSHPWRTADAVYNFFRETVLLHCVLDLPESTEVFTITQCELLFKFFRSMYLENLPLLRIVCHPNYHFTMTLCNTSQSDNANA